MSTAEDINISVQTQFLPHMSDPAVQRYAFAYTVTIRNLGHDTVQLRNRFWQITNGNNDTQEVSGSGVVGEEPILTPNADYTYTSGSVIDTPVGSMTGHYEFEGPNGILFKVPIPRFGLYHTNSLN
jgi:ApaG protein